LVFLLMLGPVGAVAYLFPGDGSAGLIAVAVLFAWAVKAALIEPFALACLLQVFYRETESQMPNAEWRGRLTYVSEKFRKLGEQALGGGLHPARAADPD
jgi:hypothetical protein